MATQYVSHTKLPLMLRRSVVVFIEVYNFLPVDFQILSDRLLAQFGHFQRFHRGKYACFLSNRRVDGDSQLLSHMTSKGKQFSVL